MFFLSQKKRHSRIPWEYGSYHGYIIERHCHPPSTLSLFSLHFPSPILKRNMSAQTAYLRVFEAHASGDAHKLQTSLAEARSTEPSRARPLTLCALKLDHVPRTRDDFGEIRVPVAAVTDVQKIFGTRYATTSSDGVIATMIAENPAEHQAYAVGWGKVVLELSGAATSVLPAVLEDAPRGAFPRQFVDPDILLPPHKAPGKPVLEPPLVTVLPEEVPAPGDVRPPTQPQSLADLMIFDDGVDAMTRSYFPGAPSAPSRKETMGQAPPKVPVPDRSKVNQVLRKAMRDGADPSMVSGMMEAMEGVYDSTNQAMQTAWNLMDEVFDAKPAARAQAYAIFSNMQNAVSRATKDAKNPLVDYREHSAALHTTFNASSLGLVRLAQRIADDAADNPETPTHPNILVRHEAVAAAQTYFNRLTGDDDGLQLADDLLDSLVHAVRAGKFSVGELRARNWETLVQREREAVRLMCDGMRDAGDIPEKDRTWLLTFLEEFDSLTDSFAKERADALLDGVWTGGATIGARTQSDDGPSPPGSPRSRRRREPRSGSSTPREPLRRERSADRQEQLREEDAEEETRIRIGFLEALGATPVVVRVLILTWFLSFMVGNAIRVAGLGPAASQAASPLWTTETTTSAGATYFGAEDSLPAERRATEFMQILDDIHEDIRPEGGAIWAADGRISLDGAQSRVNNELRTAYDVVESRNRAISDVRGRILNGVDTVTSSGAQWTARAADLAILRDQVEELRAEGVQIPNVEALRLDAAQERARVVEKMQQEGNGQMQAIMNAAHDGLQRPAVRDGEAGLEHRAPAHGWLSRLQGITSEERVAGTDSEPGARAGISVDEARDALRSAAIEDGSYGADAQRDAQRDDVARSISANGDNLVAHAVGIGPGAGSHGWTSLPGDATDATWKLIGRQYDTIAGSVGYTIAQVTGTLERMKTDYDNLRVSAGQASVDLERYNSARMNARVFERLRELQLLYGNKTDEVAAYRSAVVDEYRAAFRVLSRNSGTEAFDATTTRLLVDSGAEKSALISVLLQNTVGADSVAIRPLVDFASGIRGLTDILMARFQGSYNDDFWWSYVAQTFQYWMIAASALDFASGLLTAIAFRRATGARAVSAARSATEVEAHAAQLRQMSLQVRAMMIRGGVDTGVPLPGADSLGAIPDAVTTEDFQQRISAGSSGIVSVRMAFNMAQQVLLAYAATVLSATIFPSLATMSEAALTVASVGAIASVSGALTTVTGALSAVPTSAIMVATAGISSVTTFIATLTTRGLRKAWWSSNRRMATRSVQEMSEAYARGGHSISGLILRTLAQRAAAPIAIATIGAVANLVHSSYAEPPLARWLSQSVSIGSGGLATVEPVSRVELAALQSVARSGDSGVQSLAQLFQETPVDPSLVADASDVLSGETQRLILQYTGETLEIFRGWLSSIGAASSTPGFLGAPLRQPRPTATTEELRIFEELFIRRTSTRSAGELIVLLVAMSKRA